MRGAACSMRLVSKRQEASDRHGDDPVAALSPDVFDYLVTQLAEAIAAEIRTQLFARTAESDAA